MDRACIEQLADVWSSIAALCATLSPAAWDVATDCPGWSVKDNVSHLIGIESMLLGRPSPPPAPTGLAHVRNELGQHNEAWVVARRARSGAEVLAEFDEVTAARLTALAAMTDDELGAPTPSPIGEVPYAAFMDVRVMDCWVHEQDIRRAVGRPGHLEGPAADTSVARLTASFGFAVGKRLAPPEGTTVVWEITGAQARTLAVAVRDGRAVAVDRPLEATVEVVSDVEPYVCLVTGRWDAARALAAPGVVVRGDRDLAIALMGAMAVIP